MSNKILLSLFVIFAASAIDPALIPINNEVNGTDLVLRLVVVLRGRQNRTEEDLLITHPVTQSYTGLMINMRRVLAEHMKSHTYEGISHVQLLSGVASEAPLSECTPVERAVHGIVIKRDERDPRRIVVTATGHTDEV